GTGRPGSEHIMKVEPRAESSRDVAPLGRDSLRTPPAAGESPADAVNLSHLARVADEAVRAAAMSGDVRPAAVARATQLMLSGALDSNFEALADRIIDSLLESRDDRT